MKATVELLPCCLALVVGGGSDAIDAQPASAQSTTPVETKRPKSRNMRSLHEGAGPDEHGDLYHSMRLEARSSLPVVWLQAERCYRAGGVCSLAITAKMRSA